MSGTLTIERSGPVATIWLDRPDKHNALGFDFWEQFPETVNDLGNDDTVRALIIAGKGPSFTAGLDRPTWVALGLPLPPSMDAEVHSLKAGRSVTAC